MSSSFLRKVTHLKVTEQVLDRIDKETKKTEILRITIRSSFEKA